LDVTEATGLKDLPSAKGFAAQQAIAVLRKHNIQIAPLLKRAGISESDIDNPDRRVSAMAQGMLLECSAEALGDHVFGLHLAQQVNPRELGLLFYVASAAEDVGDALTLAARYCRIVNEAVRLKLVRSPEGMIVEAKFVRLPRHFAWQNTEFLIAGMIKGFGSRGLVRFQSAGSACTTSAEGARPRRVNRFSGGEPERRRSCLTRRHRARRHVSNDDRDRASRGDGE
jgi:Arabinose-binding domain of AraC transcription regulator, N-term